MSKFVKNAIIGQSGGPTAAINATAAGVIYGIYENRDLIPKVYGMRNGIEGFLNENLIDLSGLSDGELQKLIRTPASAFGSCRRKLPDVTKEPETYAKIFEIFEKYDIGYFFYIGGNDSMDTVAKLSAYAKEKKFDVRIIGVPKTIDNDLVETDHTPGFGSAAKYIAVTVGEIIRDCAVYTIPAVTIVEIMGRDSGWLTASSAVGRIVNGLSPDLVYLPEIDFDTEKFLADVKAALDRHPNVVIAVSEGLRSADGHYVGEGTQSGVSDVFGHKYLAGTGNALTAVVKERFGCKVRAIELNLCQRCAAHLQSKTDIDESVAVGKAAVAAATSGVYGEMMTINRKPGERYAVEYGHVDASKVANFIKTVDRKFINEAGNNVTDECCRYLLPLIQGEVKTEFVGGLPEYFVI